MKNELEPCSSSMAIHPFQISMRKIMWRNTTLTTAKGKSMNKNNSIVAIYPSHTVTGIRQSRSTLVGEPGKWSGRGAYPLKSGLIGEVCRITQPQREDMLCRK